MVVNQKVCGRIGENYQQLNSWFYVYICFQFKRKDKGKLGEGKLLGKNPNAGSVGKI